MSRFLLLGLLLSLQGLCAQPTARAFSALPLRFEPDQGHSGQGIEYVARSGASTVLLGPGGATLKAPGARPIGLELLHGQATAGEPMDPLHSRSNYFIGRDPANWRRDVPNFGRVRYRGVWPGIDLVYYGTGNRLEYDFIVAPGADPGSIGFDVRSGGSVRIDSGDLILADGRAEAHRRLKSALPCIYQETAAGRRFVAGRYVLEAGNRVRFRVGEYDRTLPLVIDPVISYSTLFGGSGNDSGGGIAADSGGFVYIAGTTDSSDLPGGVSSRKYAGSFAPDIFVAKLKPDASDLVYTAYIGGEGDDEARAIAVDAAGNAYVTGSTTSTGFPSTGGVLQAAFGRGNQDAFVLKLGPNGNALVYATYLGGSGAEEGRAIAVDQNGDAFVTGVTNSLNFPLSTAAYQKRFMGGAFDGFVAMLNPLATALVYSTLLGSSGDDELAGIAVDSTGNAFITGWTTANDFPTTTGAYQNSAPNATSCPFVTKLNAAGSALVYSTFLGGDISDKGKGIALDFSGNAYIAGVTSSPNFPVTDGVYQAALAGPSDAFVAELNSTGGDLVFATYLGGTGDDGATAIDLDLIGNIYVAGDTSSRDLAATASLQAAAAGGVDGFVAKLNAAGAKLIFASYLGGSLDEHATALAVDPESNAYVLGTTLSANFPTTPGVLRASLAAQDSFVVKVQDVLLPLLAADSASLDFAFDPIGQQPAPKTIQLTSNRGPVSYSAFTSGGNWLTLTPATGNTPGAITVSVNPANLALGTYKGSIVIAAAGAANSPLTIPVTFSFTRGSGANPGGSSPGSAVSPNPLMAGSSDTTITVTGSNFSPGATVQVNGVPVATNFVDSGTVTAVIPASFLATAGNLIISVVNAGSTAASVTYTVPVVAPTPIVSAIVNGASLLPGVVAAGEIVVIQGSLMGPANAVQAPGGADYGTNLGGTQVWFDQTPAALLYASDVQVIAIVPYEVAIPVTEMQVEYNGGKSNPTQLAVAASAPGLFTQDGSGLGQASVLNEDGTGNDIFNSALAGSMVTFSATGGGATTPTVVDGAIAGDPAPLLNLPVTMTINDEPAAVVSAGPVPGLVSGILQIQVTVPADVSGQVSAVLSIGGNLSQPGVTLVVQPMLPPVDEMRRPVVPGSVRRPRQ